MSFWDFFRRPYRKKTIISILVGMTIAISSINSSVNAIINEEKVSQVDPSSKEARKRLTTLQKMPIILMNLNTEIQDIEDALKKDNKQKAKLIAKRIRGDYSLVLSNIVWLYENNLIEKREYNNLILRMKEFESELSDLEAQIK
jgi:ferredoxin-fold anticodon binding domain-containing protein